MPKQTTDTPPATPPTSEPTPPATGGGVMGKAVSVVAILLLLGATSTAGYFYKQLADIKKNPSKVAQDETKATLDAVAKLIVLPEGEQPTLATVSDPEKLKDQPFFASAQKGDKVLIYTNAKKAILYNPTQNKIVEVAPINIGSSDQSQVSGSSTTTSTKTTTPTPKK